MVGFVKLCPQLIGAVIHAGKLREGARWRSEPTEQVRGSDGIHNRSLDDATTQVQRITMPDTAQKTDNSSTNNGQPTSPALERVKTQIASSLFISFPVLLVTILGALIFLFWVIHGQGPRNGQPDAGQRTIEKMALAASVQVAIGMVMGFVSVFMGLMITWFGIVAAFEFSGTVGDKATATLKGASPGLLFYLGGIILIGVSLYKPIIYEEPGHVTRVPVNEPREVNGMPHKPLPPFNKTEK